ncbi:bifunctional DNA primase/polymerase [Myxococcus sp. Y35]|uniref:bifunctional DNA primase/polymerase n=1 Tax=Pseudomyxococcus flavus TaxID=3115648 RepID=UPI003CE91EB5
MSKVAAFYAREVGWRVIPLHNITPAGVCSCQEGASCPVKQRGKHPRLSRWQDRGTRDPQEIASWWGKWKDGNVGIVTGEESGIFALDVDPENGGRDSLAALVDKYGPLPRTTRAMTGSGGDHYLFRWPEGGVSNTANKVGPGLDVRGTGGQIVAAPSVSGRGQYRWILPPWETPPADAPDWLLARVRAPAERAEHSWAPSTFPPATPAVLDEAREALRRHGPSPARVDGEGGGLHAVQAAMILVRDFALSDEEAWPLLVEWNARNPTPFDLEDDGPEGLRYRLARGRKSAKGTLGAKRKPVIELVAGRLAEIASEAEDALVQARVPIYVRGARLVRPVVEEAEAAHGRRTKIARLAKLEGTYTRDLMARHAKFARFDKRAGELVTADPPLDVAQTVLAREGEWRFPTLAGVITCPTMRPDGSILSAPGYDAETRLVLMAPPNMPAIPDAPTPHDAQKALAVLLALLDEFPFVDDASRSVALSAIITPVVRGAFPVSPGHVFSASTPGTGKSFACDVAAAVALGQPMPVMSAGPSEEEMEKRLSSAIMTGQPLVSLDNVSAPLGGDALCQILERPIVEVRVLGKSELIRVESRSTMYATGNNILLRGDVTRRMLLARLEANMERPELRAFKRNPVAEVLADRGRYVAAALTIARAYVVAGRPACAAAPLASFQGWSDTVRSALIWLGCADPCATMETARAEDPLMAMHRSVLTAWAERLGTGAEKWRTAADLLKEAERFDPHSPALQAFKDAISAVSSNRGRPDGRTLGKWLSKHKGRPVDGLRIVGQSDHHGSRWWVERLP